jgi:DNA-binding beta-propeller fold protein YncE
VRPLGTTRTSSTIALAQLGAKRVAFVADEDARAVVAIDVDSKNELATTALSGVPGHLLVMADGRVIVALRDRSEIAVLAAEGERGALVTACVAPAPAEPIALAATPDERTVLVTSGWGHTLRAYDATSLARAFDVDLAREPRAIVVSDDGATAFVSHAAGAVLSAVDLRKNGHPVQQLAMRGDEPDEAVATEIDVRGVRAGEVDDIVLQAVDAAIRADLKSLRVIHGKGTGVLRQRVAEMLRKDTRVRGFRLGEFNEGGAGVTVVDL